MKEKNVLRIEGEFTIFRAAELKPVVMASPPPCEIDLSGVTEIDSAGVQLLMLAKKAALAEKRQFRLVAHSPAVTEVFELLNLAAYFDDPLLVSSRAGAGRKSGSTKKRGANGS
ncbi:MAG: STAS domain-containing protein [Rhodoferax sp.]